MSPTYYTIIDSPLGPLCLTATEQGLTQVDFEQGERPVVHDPSWQADTGWLTNAVQQLQEYFQGTRQHFTLPLAPAGTPFQHQVWQELQRIPFGTTISYRELAQRLGKANGARAVGHANGRNPISIIIPCHRVVGADGHLRGYAGGLPIKQHLLQHEGAWLV
ncbi:MAG: methylated-DNA--[protein]-cysteine S-methyltransferase [Candidatus Tectomicrobia bacterium]